MKEYCWLKRGRFYGICMGTNNKVCAVYLADGATVFAEDYRRDGKVFDVYRTLEWEARRQHNKAMWEAHIAQLRGFFSLRFGKKGVE